MSWIQKRKTQLTNVAFLIGALMMAPATSAETTASDPKSGQWRIAGQDLSNSRNQPAEHLIGTGNVKKLSPQWTFTTGGDVSATPTVDGNAVYFPDWAGNLFAVEKKSGRLIWSHKIAEYNGVAGSVSRVSPALDGDQVILGDILSSNQVHKGANVISVHRKTGKLQWITQVDSHPAAVITGSPVVFKGVVYVGVSSIEETLATDPAYPCCTFRGSMVALDEKSGEILWQTFVLPENGGVPGGYSGNAIWEPPAIDPKRGSLFIGTGNNYTAPADVEACQNADPSANCAAADDFFDAALALDLKTGAIKWSKRLQGFDVWTVACLRPTGPKENCPVPGSPDFDFGGSGPNLVGNIVGIGQKSGIYWALDPDDGRIVWTAAVGPGGSLGGIEWGTATDGERIYVAIGNNGHLPYTLVPSGQKITWGSWSALDVKTGNILWQTADPTAGTMDTGAVSVANGVLYAGSYAGQMYALDAKTGEILWGFPSGGSVIDAPSILDGFVYWGSGYRNIPPGIGNNKVFAFTLGSGEKDKESKGKGGK
jgi:polyvinyl alcohol dehydrogenase (cytochrome)